MVKVTMECDGKREEFTCVFAALIACINITDDTFYGHTRTMGEYTDDMIDAIKKESNETLNILRQEYIDWADQ